MESAYRFDLKLIYAINFLFPLTNSLVAISIPLFAYSLGASQLEIGILGFAYMGIQIPFSVYFGRLSDKVGRLKLLALCLLCSSAALTLLTVSNSLPLLYAIRLILGLASSIYYPISGALTADSAPPRKMVKVLVIANIFYGISWAVGPSISGYLIEYQNFTSTFLLANIVTLTMFPLIIFMSRRGHRSQGIGLRSFEKPLATETSRANQAQKSILAWAFIVVALQGFILGVNTNIFPVYSVIIGFSKTETGFFLTIGNVMSVLLFLFIGRLSERVTKLNMCILGTTLCMAIIMVPFARDFTLMTFSIAIVGLGTAIIYPTSKAAVVEMSQTKRGSYLGVYEGIATSGMAVGSLLGGALANYVALEAPYYFTITMALAVILFLTFFSRKRINKIT